MKRVPSLRNSAGILRGLAIVPIVWPGIAYSANSLMFSMATGCDYGNVG